MQTANLVAKNTAILYARMAITMFISLYATRLILGALGTKDFGLFNVVGGAIAMLGFLNASMTAASQRFMSYAHGARNIQRVKQIFNVSLVLHIIIAIAIFFVLEIAGYFFFNGILNISPERLHAGKLIYQFMIVSTLFTVIGVPYDAVINAHENMLLFAILSVIESVSKLFIAFYITQTTGDRLIVYGIMMAALSIFLLLMRWFYCNRKYKECRINIRSNYDKKLMKEMTGFAGWSLVGSSSSMLSNYGQGIVLNIFFGTVVNAAQGIANQVSGQLGAFSVTMLKALNPVLGKSAGAGNRELMLKATMMGSKVSFFLLLIFYVPVLIEMPYIFHFWLHNVPDYAIIFCRLLLIQNLIKQLFITLNSTILAMGKIRQYQIYFSILTFMNLPVTYLFFKQGFPPYSLYLVFLVYSVLYGALILNFGRKTFELPIWAFVKEVIFKCTSLFLFLMSLSVIPTLLMHQGIGRLFLVSLISTVSFLLLLWFYGFSLSERISFKQMGISLFHKIGSKNQFIRNRFLKVKYE